MLFESYGNTYLFHIRQSMYSMCKPMLCQKVIKYVYSSRKEKFFRIDLPSPLGQGKEITVDVEATYSHSLRPYPAEITQSEKQFVQFTGNSHFYSPYRVTSSTTVVNCASSSIESYTKNKPVSTQDNSITYGAYENLQPFSQVCFHYMIQYKENTFPITSLLVLAY